MKIGAISPKGEELPESLTNVKEDQIDKTIKTCARSLLCFVVLNSLIRHFILQPWRHLMA
jgi:hypothetical protein